MERVNIDPIGHTIVTVAAVAPSCTSPGKTEGSYCSICGVTITEQRIIPALGHNFIDTITPPTELERGYTTHTCSRCDYSYRDNYVDPIGPTGSVGLAYEDNGQGLCWITGIGSCTDKDIIVPSSIGGSKVYAIVANAFTNQKSITSITLPETLEVIGKGAFTGCDNLESINIPKNLTNIYSYCFPSGYDSKFKSVLISSDNLHIYGDGYLFEDYYSIKTAVFEGKRIPANICRKARALEEVIICNGVEEIGETAFWECDSLKNVKLSSSVKSIGRQAFPEYITISYEGTIAQWNAIKKDSLWAGFLPTYKIYCNDGIIDGLNGTTYY